MRRGTAGWSGRPRDPQRYSCWDRLAERAGSMPFSEACHRMVVERSAIALSGCLRVVQPRASAGSAPGGLGPSFRS